MSDKDKPVKSKNDFGEFSENPDKLYEIVEQLSEENTQIKDARLEERFVLWIVISILLAFIGLPTINWLPATILLLLGIFILIELGRRWGIEEVVIYRDKLFYWIDQYCKK